MTAAKSGQVKSTASGMSYLEMKYNLLMSYCTFLAFYLLLKVEGKPVENHPVVHKLTHIKTLFEKLKPVDQKLQYQVEKMSSLTEATAGESSNALAHKPNIKDLDMVSDDEDDDEEGEGLEDMDLDDDDMEEGESDIENDMGGPAAQSEDASEDEGKAKRSRVVEKGGVYKAPKVNAVTYEDAKDKKKRMKEEF